MRFLSYLENVDKFLKRAFLGKIKVKKGKSSSKNVEIPLQILLRTPKTNLSSSDPDLLRAYNDWINFFFKIVLGSCLFLRYIFSTRNLNWTRRGSYIC